MAIHIDIYAHLKKTQLIKEGEQLRKYVESLEKDANQRLEKGAQGRSQKLIRLNDQQAKSYDQLINASDSYVSSLRAEKAAEAALTSLKKTKLRDIKDEEKHAKALAAAEREVVAAQKDRVFKAQRLTAAANGQTRAMADLNEENTAHTKNARQVGALLTANRTRMAKLSTATNQARREMESLHDANQTAVKDSKAVAGGLGRVKEATEKTAVETKKLNEMVKDGVTDYKKLRDQSERVKNAHKAEQKAIKGVTGGMKDLVKSHQLSRVVVDANSRSLKDYAAQSQQSIKQVRDLYKSNNALIDSNAKLSRSFTAARDATKAANREHQEYKRLVANGASQDVLRKKADRVSDAYQKQAREVSAAGKELNDALTFRNDRSGFIASQSSAMSRFASEAADASTKLGDLRTSNEGALRSSGQLSKAFNAAAGSTRRAGLAQKEYDRLVASGAGRDALQKAAEKASDAYAQQRRDVDEATNALRRHQKETRADGIRGLTGGPGEYASRNIAALTPLGRVNSGVGLPLLGLAGNFAEAGVTASQSIALLPALATSAAAAIGTLAIGFHGFFQTLGDMGDPKKFGEGLLTLAPNAQQAAIEIKRLVDGPLGELKKMVQEDLFANVAPQLNAVVTTFGPQMNALFGGLSKEFNKAFVGITNVLMMPESQASLTGIVDGIVAGFQHLLPMLSPFTQAFLKLTEVGVSFLPQIGDLFTKAATSFNNFIQQSAADGSLQNFLQKGIDAAVYLIDWIKRLGVQVYETFGNKSPAEFANALEGALSAIGGIMSAIQSLSDVINALAPVVSSVFGGLSDAVGGASNLAYIFVGIWTGRKLFTAIDTVAGLFGKSIGGALTGLIGTAEKSSTGITAALAKVKIPPALLSILGKGGAIAAGAFAGYEIADSTLDSDWMNNAQMQNGGTGPLGLGDNSIVKWINRNTPDWLGGDHVDADGRWIDSRTSRTPEVPAGSAPADSSLFPGAAAAPFDWAGGTDPAASPWSPQALPSNAGKYEFANIPIGQFQGAQWQVPAGATDLPVDYDNLGKQGFYRPDPLKIMDAQGTVDNKRQTAEEARSKYLDLVASGNTRQEELNKAANDVVQAEQGWLSSMRDLKVAERGEFEDLTGQMDKFGKDLKASLGDMGAALDPDLGISKGLAGMADNLVRFVGSLALAPTIAKLKKGQFDAGYPNGEGGGMGLMGMLTIGRSKPTRDTNKENADAYRAQYGIDNYGLSTVTPGGPVPTDVPETLRASLAAAGIDPAMYGVIGGFAKTEGNNPSGVPTLGFTDSQAGTSLAGHADALAKQIGARSSVTGPFPAGGNPQEQASWMATLVGQNGVASDWQGNAQPARSDYVNRIVSAMGVSGAQSGVPTGATTVPTTPTGAPYGLPTGTDTGGYGSGGKGIFPDWVQQVGAAFGVTASTYAGHQESDRNEAGYAPNPGHENRGIDWTGSPQAMQQFADYLKTVPGMEQVIWNGAGQGTGDTVEIAGGRSQPGYFAGDLAGHGNHVHTRQSGAIPLPGQLPMDAMTGALPGMPGGSPIGGMGSIPSGSGTPVFVTNWPGGGGGGGGVPGVAPMVGAPGGPPVPHLGTGAPPGPTPGGGAPGSKPLIGGGAATPGPKPFIGPVPFIGPMAAAGPKPPPSPANLPQWENATGFGNWVSKALTGGPNKLPWDDATRYGLPDLSGAGRWLGNLLNTEDKNEFGGGGGSFAPDTALGDLLGVGNPGSAKPTATEDILRGITSPSNSTIGPGLTPAINPAILNPGKLPGFANGGEVPIMAHSGEHVLTRRDVAAMGGHQGVLDFRNSLQSFDGGGPVLDIGPGGAGPQPKGKGPDAGKAPAPKPEVPAVAPPEVPAAAGPVATPVPHGTAMGAAPGPPPVAAPTPIGAQHEGNVGIGKGFDVDTSALTGGLAGAVPGAQAGIKLAERGIEYAGQVAAIGVQGLMETFLPTGGSELANNNWLTRIAGAVAGAAPAIANVAGGKSNPEGGATGGLPQGPTGIPGLGPATPEQIAAQSMAPAAQAAPAAPNVTNFNYTANGVKGAEEAFPDAARAWEARPGQR